MSFKSGKLSGLAYSRPSCSVFLECSDCVITRLLHLPSGDTNLESGMHPAVSCCLQGEGPA